MTTMKLLSLTKIIPKIPYLYNNSKCVPMYVSVYMVCFFTQYSTLLKFM